MSADSGPNAQQAFARLRSKTSARTKQGVARLFSLPAERTKHPEQTSFSSLPVISVEESENDCHETEPGTPARNPLGSRNMANPPPRSLMWVVHKKNDLTNQD